MIRAIAAVDDQLGIAAGGVIPWDIPSDVRYFRRQTKDGVVLMGRETYEQFEHPLPERRNVVASHQLRQVRSGFELIDDAVKFVRQNNDVWVIGGAGLYESLLAECDELLLTHISGDYNCNRRFPSFNDAFVLATASKVMSENGYSFYFAVYRRNR